MAERIPDALRVPIGWRGPSQNQFKRANTLLDRVEPLLGVGLGGAHARTHGHVGEFFVTRSPFDTLLFPGDHPTHPKQPRYDWEARPEQGPGVFFGYLKPECAELDAAAVPATPGA